MSTIKLLPRLLIERLLEGIGTNRMWLKEIAVFSNCPLIASINN
jgi:hypothetical protein